MKSLTTLLAVLAVTTLAAAPLKVDLSKEKTGATPVSFEPMVGSWVVAEDAGEKVIMLDGRPWAASRDNPSRMLLQGARKLYGTTNEELMDNAKQFAYYPIAVLREVPSFSNGTLSVKFKTIGGDADRASGLLFNVKPNGDWLAVRYSDAESNLGLWEFHNGVRRLLAFSNRLEKFVLDRATWHELTLEIASGSSIKASVDGRVGIEYTLGTAPVVKPGAPAPNPDLFPENNPVIRPPVNGRVGLWSKSDSTIYFKDYVVTPK
jgi:hypothetical protein